MVRICLIALCLLCAPALGQLNVVSTDPPLNAQNVSLVATIAITFDRPVDPTTFTDQSLWCFGRWSGPRTSQMVFSNANRTVQLTAHGAFFAGEVVMVI